MRDDPVSLDVHLAIANIDVRLAEHRSGFFIARNPALWTGEAIFGAVSLMIRDFAPVVERAAALRSRLSAIPAFLAAIPQSITAPVSPQWIARARRECTAVEWLFEHGLQLWLGQQQLHYETTQAIRDAAVEARHAFRETAVWLDTLMPGSDEACAVGRETFDLLLARGHCCDESADELLAQALVALPREQEALARMAADVAGSWPAAQAAMLADRPTVDTYYAAFAQRWDECRRIASAHDLVTWADWPIRYVPIPTWAAHAAPHLYWLFYRSPAPFDPYDVYNYVVTPIDHTLSENEQQLRLQVWNNSTITLNHVVHHGAIGHHVQNWHARYRSTSRIGSIAATDCASRIGMFLGGSMAEGWACYATQLMEECGMLTPLERVSEQHTRVRMLARAIVDIRLHTGQCTFTEAVQFYRDSVGMSDAVATAEATKNSMFPCTALMYWLGTKQILALRETLRVAKGEQFSMREFHDALLSRGAIPVALAATLMTESFA